MPTGPERATDTSEPKTHRCKTQPTASSAADENGLSRRRALAVAGTLSLGLTAGCLDSVRYFGQARVPVEPTNPGDDPAATPGEFHFLLEQNDIAVDEVYHDTEENDILLFYRSDATDRSESDDEIALIYRVFSEGIVARGSDINHLYTEVVDPFEGQAEGWGVNADWAREHQNEELSDLDLWNAIINTKVYPDGESPYGDAGNETDDGNETEAGALDTDDGNETETETESGDSSETDDSDETAGASDEE